MDSTYITDIIEGIIRVINKVSKNDKNWNFEEPNPESSISPYRLYTIGINQPGDLKKFHRSY